MERVEKRRKKKKKMEKKWTNLLAEKFDIMVCIQIHMEVRK